MENTILTATEGMWLTNGDTFGKTVTLPPNADASVWYEISDAEKVAIEDRLAALEGGEV